MDLRCCDCFEGLASLADGSIDAAFCDPPYNMTANKWDNAIDLTRFMGELFRVTKRSGCVAVFGIQPFVTDVINAGRKHFRYNLIYQKPQGSDFFHSRLKPLRDFEEVLIFYKRRPTYHPQMESGHAPYHGGGHSGISTLGEYQFVGTPSVNATGQRYPKSVLRFTPERGGHTTPKPVKLLEWLIRTYTDEGELVLDATFGSGSTAVAARNTGRRFVGFEINPEFVRIAEKRIAPL